MISVKERIFVCAILILGCTIPTQSENADMFVESLRSMNQLGPFFEHGRHTRSGPGSSLKVDTHLKGVQVFSEGNTKLFSLYMPNKYDDSSIYTRNDEHKINFFSGIKYSTAIKEIGSGVFQSYVKINSADAPTQYVFKTWHRNGATLHLGHDGGAFVYSTEQEEVIAYFPPPWAKDARGNIIDTKYTLTGYPTKLVLNVAFTRDASFPIFADPFFIPLGIVLGASVLSTLVQFLMVNNLPSTSRGSNNGMSAVEMYDATPIDQRSSSHAFQRQMERGVNVQLARTEISFHHRQMLVEQLTVEESRERFIREHPGQPIPRIYPRNIYEGFYMDPLRQRRVCFRLVVQDQGEGIMRNEVITSMVIDPDQIRSPLALRHCPRRSARGENIPVIHGSDSDDGESWCLVTPRPRRN